MTITGSDRVDVVRQITGMLGPEGTSEAGAYVYTYLGGHYSGQQRGCIVECSDAEWAEAVLSIPACLVAPPTE